MSLQLLLLMCVLLPVVKPACGPVEEGKPTILTCNVNKPGCSLLGSAVDWRVPDYLTVIHCVSNECGGGFSPQYFTADVSFTSSTLTINNVSRTDPFNMETKWECLPCYGRDPVPVCEKLQIYSLPSNPLCQVTENIVSGDIQSVTFACTYDYESVYPPVANCSLYKIKDGGSPVKIPNSGSSSCSVTLSVLELGVGTHSFQGKIFPDVTDGESKVTWTIPTPNTAVTLSFSEVSHTCITSITLQRYFVGNSARCNCNITVDGNPRGTPQWYNEAHSPVGTAGVLDIAYDKNNPAQTFTCEAKSELGRNVGSTLTAQFVFLSDNSVQVIPPSSPIKLCNNNNNLADVECRISKGDINPPPIFSFALDGPVFSDPKPGTEIGDNYIKTFSFSRNIGGEYQVSCKIVNPILGATRDKTATVLFQKPPPGPPQLTISGQTYQGTVPKNIVTVAEGYSGDVTCRVEGGYPNAINTNLECDQLKDIGPGNIATLSFKDNSLTRNMNGKVCTCTGSHVSGCYSDKRTMVTLNVTYPPDVTFTKDKPDTTFNKGDSISFPCSAQGNPDPTMTLTREGTDHPLKGPQATTLTHTLDSLDCLDTGVYVCSGLNSQGTDSRNILVNVLCHQQFSPVFKPQPVIDAVMRSTAQIVLQVYGFPEPTSLTLKAVDGTNITSGRHMVNYTAVDAPFGNVTVTVFDIVESDYTNYTLSVDNGVGAALVYKFFLNKVNSTSLPDKEEDTEKSSKL